MEREIYMTRGIANDIADSDTFAQEIMSFMHRFFKRDWGDDMCEEDKQENETALKYGGRLFGFYHSSKGKVYIITDDTKAAKQVTTVLYADEY